MCQPAPSVPETCTVTGCQVTPSLNTAQPVPSSPQCSPQAYSSAGGASAGLSVMLSSTASSYVPPASSAAAFLAFRTSTAASCTTMACCSHSISIEIGT